jgi:zinc protease
MKQGVESLLVNVRGIGGIVSLLAACTSGSAALPVHAPAAPDRPSVAPVDPLDVPTPIDRRVVKGTLPNGLTYYVRRHETPEQRASLWLAVDAGSLLEDDDQRGIAHFVEHMAFNGTKRFPKQGIVDFFERAGMTMGADVNAHTGLDGTVYKFTVPTDDVPVMLEGLDVLVDIARSVSFDPNEVELERPVILEEWRLGRGAGRRLLEKQVPRLFDGSRYADRITIGMPETIRAAPVETLRRYYDDWYRPEAMAVIAVGDFDPARMEREIKSRFAGLAGTPKRRARGTFTVPRDHAPAIVVENDPELRSSFIHVYDKVEPTPNRTRRDYRRWLVERLYLEILNRRLIEIMDDAEYPFVGTNVERKHLARTLDAVRFTIRVKEGKVEEALAALFGELERVKRYGFLLNETLRAGKELVAEHEAVLVEADRAPASELAAELTRNYFEGEQVPGPDLELAWLREDVPGITLKELGELAVERSSERGRVIAVSTPGSIAPPSAARVAEIVAAAKAAPMERPRDKTFADKPLIAKPPTPGKVVNASRDADADAVVWTLSNGVRVIAKPTTFKNASVVLRGFQSGGTSLVSDADFVHAYFAHEIVGRSGTSKLSERTLRRMLAGKRATVSIELYELVQSVEGRARASDLTTLLELLHIRLTQPSAAAFDIWKARRLDTARHRSEAPEQAFQDELRLLLGKNHPRRRPASVELVESVDKDRALAVWRERFADLGGFTFVLVGNFDPEKLKPLVETYLGSLPSKPPHAHWKDPNIPYPTGKVEKTLTLGSEPKARVRLVFAGPAAWGLDAWRDTQILEELLEMRLRDVLRERLGGTYAVDVDARMEREPSERRRLEIGFGCAPENVEKLVAVVFDELRALAQQGVDEQYLAKVRLRLERQRELRLADNEWWASWLLYAYWHDDDFGTVTDIRATVRRVTRENVKATVARMFDEKNYVLAVLRPASKSGPAKSAGTSVVEFPDSAP